MFALSTSFVYTVAMKVRSVHQSLYHTLSDGDVTAELHIHDDMVWHLPLRKQS